MTHESFFGKTTAPECREAVLDAARLLASLGHDVVEARPPFAREALVHAYIVALAATTAADVALAARATGRRPGPGLLELETWALAVGGEVLSSRDLVLAEREMQRGARVMAGFFEEHDLLLTPTLAHPPLPLGAIATKPLERLALGLVARIRSRVLLERYFSEISARSFEATGYTMPFNQTGQPAMSLPLHWTADGIPIGVQAVARSGDEETLFRLAAQLEQARPWADRMPPGIATSAVPGPARRDEVAYGTS